MPCISLLPTGTCSPQVRHSKVVSATDDWSWSLMLDRNRNRGKTPAITAVLLSDARTGIQSQTSAHASITKQGVAARHKVERFSSNSKQAAGTSGAGLNRQQNGRERLTALFEKSPALKSLREDERERCLPREQRLCHCPLLVAVNSKSVHKTRAAR